MEEKEDALNCLRTELEEKCRKSILAAKNQWLKEREVVTKQQVEIEVTLARAQWEKEKKKVWGLHELKYRSVLINFEWMWGGGGGHILGWHLLS